MSRIPLLVSRDIFSPPSHFVSIPQTPKSRAYSCPLPPSEKPRKKTRGHSSPLFPPPTGAQEAPLSRLLTKTPCISIIQPHSALIFVSPFPTTPQNPQRTNKTQIGGPEYISNPTPRDIFSPSPQPPSDGGLKNSPLPPSYKTPRCISNIYLLSVIVPHTALRGFKPDVNSLKKNGLRDASRPGKGKKKEKKKSSAGSDGNQDSGLTVCNVPSLRSSCPSKMKYTYNEWS